MGTARRTDVKALAERVGHGAGQIVEAAADLSRRAAALTRDARLFSERGRAG